MKKILFINFPLSYQEQFRATVESYGYQYNHISFPELTLWDNTILIHQSKISDFDFVVIGLTEKHKYISPILTDVLLSKNIPFLTYGHKPEYIHSKTQELFRLNNHNLPLIPSISSTDSETITQFVSQYHGEFISKPTDGKKGKDIVKHTTLDSILERVKAYQYPLLIQPFIPNDGDYRVWVFKDRVIGVIKRTPNSAEEFRSNISLGGKAVISSLPVSILDLTIQATQAMEFDLAGVDIIQDKCTHQFYIMEVNSAPQFQGFMATTGIDLYDVIVKYVDEQLT